jgi:hypothetical protein
MVLVAQFVFTITATAQGGNGLLAAGNYHITTSSGDYFFCCGDPSLPFVSVSVTDTTTVSNPMVGASTATQEADVFIDVCGGTNFICGGGCFIANSASDFSLSSDFSSGALNTEFDPTTNKPCENAPVSLPPFTIDVTWSGSAPLGSTRKTSTYACVGYKAEVETLRNNENATATASSSLFSGSIPAESGGVGSIDQRVNAQGVAADACNPIGLGGGGKGAGPGLTGAGGFEFAGQTAIANIPFGFVNLTTFTNISRPKGSAPSTVGEPELTVASFTFPSSVYLCFRLQTPNSFAFGSGLSSASVHAVIDQNTPACTGFTNDSFAPFTVDMTWTAAGPLASVQSEAISVCGAFHQQLLTSDRFNPAVASGTVSMFPDPIATTGSINASDHHFQSQGTAPQGCILQP